MGEIPDSLTTVTDSFYTLELVRPGSVTRGVVKISDAAYNNVSIESLPFFSADVFSNFLPEVIQVSVNSHDKSVRKFIAYRTLDEVLSRWVKGNLKLPVTREDISPIFT